MAACCRNLHKCAHYLRSVRLQQIQNERLLSTSSCRLAPSDKPGKFIPPSKPVIIDKAQSATSQRKFLSPEFIPPRQRTDPLKFSMERKDMIRRRKVLDIPEFYAGSILAVTMTDPNANGKVNRFVGICIQRGGKGLGATFVLRNIIDNQGVEICYELYNPRIQQVELLKLEKRLDDNLLYLRDALPEYSTVDPNMKPVPAPSTGEVPLNKMKVRMRPKPWSKRWERPKYNVQGIAFEQILSAEQLEHAQKWAQPWLQYDMLKEYDTSRIQEEILTEVTREMGQ
ncbi:39S ribosomal protein L19, mitochondrial [Periophthalmus magnuspinnatus]|uniref:39S ribosomal protein L19, mitochondrial n=1 Tax=Periophthalmus magnuspinnatus TaxID=409849 RepID=UPI00145BF9C1|nr:39S ribosomal protein L19, mitochondrial [Periophthalmus magnuspinnatus]